MADNEPDSQQDLAQHQRVFKDYNRFLHTSTLAACVLAPVLIVLPPRKLDLYTFLLSGAFLTSVDYQAKERTGLGVMSHATRRFTSREPPKQRIQNPRSPVWEQNRLLDEKPSVLSTEAREGSRLQQRAQEDWKQQRLKEEQEKLDQGVGYWSMIVDQVWSVWNQEEKKVELLKEEDKSVLQERRNNG